MVSTGSSISSHRQGGAAGELRRLACEGRAEIKKKWGYLNPIFRRRNLSLRVFSELKLFSDKQQI